MSRIGTLLRKLEHRQIQDEDKPGAYWWCKDTFYFNAHLERPVLLFLNDYKNCIQLPASHRKRGKWSVQIPSKMIPSEMKESYINVSQRFCHPFNKFKQHRHRFICVLNNHIYQEIMNRYKEYHKIG